MGFHKGNPPNFEASCIRGFWGRKVVSEQRTKHHRKKQKKLNHYTHQKTDCLFQCGIKFLTYFFIVVLWKRILDINKNSTQFMWTVPRVFFFQTEAPKFDSFLEPVPGGKGLNDAESIGFCADVWGSRKKEERKKHYQYQGINLISHMLHEIWP